MSHQVNHPDPIPPADAPLDHKYWHLTWERLEEYREQGVTAPPGTQGLLLSKWQDDKHNRFHPPVDDFWQYVMPMLTHDIFQKAFLETLKVMMEDCQAPIKRTIRHLQRYGAAVEWCDIEDSDYTCQRRDWDSIWANRERTSSWTVYDFQEHFIDLKDEYYYLEACRNQLEAWERYADGYAQSGQRVDFPRYPFDPREGDEQ